MYAELEYGILAHVLRRHSSLSASPVRNRHRGRRLAQDGAAIRFAVYKFVQLVIFFSRGSDRRADYSHDYVEDEKDGHDRECVPRASGLALSLGWGSIPGWRWRRSWASWRHELAAPEDQRRCVWFRASSTKIHSCIRTPHNLLHAAVSSVGYAQYCGFRLSTPHLIYCPLPT